MYVFVLTHSDAAFGEPAPLGVFATIEGARSYALTETDTVVPGEPTPQRSLDWVDVGSVPGSSFALIGDDGSYDITRFELLP